MTSTAVDWKDRRISGDIVHFSVMGKHIIVLHNIKDVIALMEKRSATYSDRPSLPILKLMEADDLSSLIPYGNEWRKHRKLFQEALGKKHIPSYEHIQMEKVFLMLELLLNNPKRFMQHCKWLGTAVTMGMTFGYELTPGQENDRFVELPEEAVRIITKLILPGSTLVNMLPFLGYIPPWVPGASSQKEAAEVKQILNVYRNEPFEYVLKNMASGNAKDCMLVGLLQGRTKIDGVYEDEKVLRDMIATAYLGACLATYVTQLNFFLAMALHPNEQKRAQEEIDRVVGTDRLPNLVDRASLPYVEALLRETLRWRLVFPLGVPHSTVNDDVYKGFYIPKGTIVIPNVWAFTQDESVYPDPESFKPERFFNSDGTLNNDTIEYAFGFGRRICAGRYVAEAVLWLVVVTVLSTFNIYKAKDENGVEIEIDPNAFIETVLSMPLPFKCSIVPRSPQAEGLIRNAVSENAGNT
ncbi:hypothetical protein AX15_001065 [Amanita polypyramis BW_CC]|nr:hypothetical protein AX15_001065 [Amanita polypyramis BW_CC]